MRHAGSSSEQAVVALAQFGAADHAHGTGVEAERRGFGEEIRPLTSLRGVLACWVVLFHLSPLLASMFPGAIALLPLWQSGDAAVDIFFLLSGYVMWLAYAERVPRFSPRTYGWFLWARLARLYPVQVSQQLAWLSAWALATALHKPGFTSDGFDTAGLLLNLGLLQAWGVPMKMYLNYPAWSVSMEWFAYLMTPAVFAVVSFTRRSYLKWLALGALWLALVASHGSPWSHYFRVICSYSAGAILASIAVSLPVSRVLGRLRGAVALLMVSMLIALGVRGLTYGYAMPLAGLLILALSVPTGSSDRFSSSLPVYIGRVSFSLYMTHALSITLMHQLVHPSKFEHSPLLVRLTVLSSYVAVILVVAVISYSLVEQPMQKRMRRRLRAWAPEFVARSNTSVI
ncbi:MAG: acyltransferase 3 [Myxococcaceae bacterium]|nr:acyltransferase 3 [Myxococcaceae bacterium]